MSSNLLIQCHIVRSSRRSSERPLPSDTSIVRLVRLANPNADTPETILRCLVDCSSTNMDSTPHFSTTEPFLQPLVEFLSQADVNYITFASSPGGSNLLKMRASSNHITSSSSSASSSGGKRSRDGLVEVAAYPAYNDGACNMNGGALKLRSPVLEQLEARSGINYRQSSSSSSPSSPVSITGGVIPISIVMAWESPDHRKVNVTLQSSVHNNTNQQSIDKGSAVVTSKDSHQAKSRDLFSAATAPRGVSRGSVVFLNEPNQASLDNNNNNNNSNNDNNDRRSSDPKGRSVSSSSLYSSSSVAASLSLVGDRFGDADALQRTTAEASDEENEQGEYEEAGGTKTKLFKQGRASSYSASTSVSGDILYELPNLVAGGGGGGGASGSKTMTEARARRLEMLRRESIAKREQLRQERERQARQHAEQWEQELAERRLTERNLQHQAEVARQRHEARGVELVRKKTAYEGREVELEREKKEFDRRLEEARTLQQIEILQKQGRREKAGGGGGGSGTFVNQHHQSMTNSISASSKSIMAELETPPPDSVRRFTAASFPNSSDSHPIVGGGAVMPSKQSSSSNNNDSNHNHLDHLLSSRLEKDIDREIEASIHSQEGQRSIDELERQRGEQLREATDQAALQHRLAKLHRDKARYGSQVRARLLEYKASLQMILKDRHKT